MSQKFLPNGVKPMRGEAIEDTKVLEGRYPWIMQPKIDGIRGLINSDGLAVSRSGKLLPNQDLQRWLWERPFLKGCDCEITVGVPYGDGVYRRSNSGIMSEFGPQDWHLTIFDLWAMNTTRYDDRLCALQAGLELLLADHPTIKIISSTWVENLQEFEAAEELHLEQGYEGSMAKLPWQTYKYGKSTLNEGKCLKVKRFEDAEAYIVGYEPKYTHIGESTLDAFGHQKRDSKAENLRAEETLGALICTKDLAAYDNDPTNPDLVFKIGSGFDFAERDDIWDRRISLMRSAVVYKHQPHGNYDKPRAPIFKGYRDTIDMEPA